LTDPAACKMGKALSTPTGNNFRCPAIRVFGPTTAGSSLTTKSLAQMTGVQKYLFEIKRF
jgi:hypothetical protein